MERYKNIIHAIANIDAIFDNGDGTERPWHDKEALAEIKKLVMPIWDEYCQETREANTRLFGHQNKTD